jgi:23S rRNA (uracil1939-C5)-methyltransferase
LPLWRRRRVGRRSLSLCGPSPAISSAAAYDAVVFDPPRAGATAQAKELAASRVTKLVAVSCNPGTLARDLRILVDGGYRITRIVPVDQFLFSPHIEVVAHLER